MNTLLMKALSVIPLVPSVIGGVEGIVSEAKSGGTKKQMAVDALKLAAGIADTVAPAEQPLVDAAANVIGTSIDAWVGLFNQLGIFKKKTPAPAVAPAFSAAAVAAAIAKS